MLLEANKASRSEHLDVRLIKREVSEETLAGMCKICHKEDVHRKDLGHSALGRELSLRHRGSTLGPRSAEPPKSRDSLVTRQE